MAPSLSNGGAERVAAMWANGFVNRGFEVFFALTTDSKTATYMVSERVKLYNICPCKGNNAFVNRVQVALFSTRTLRRLIKQIDPDIVISVMRAELVSKACRGLRCRFISTEHSSFERPEGAPPIPQKLYRQKFVYNKRADLITVLTKQDLDYIGTRLKNVHYLPNPLAFTPVETVPPKKNIILAVGRIDGWYVKGFDNLIKAWGAICHRYPQWELHIVGSSTFSARLFLQSIADSYGIREQLKILPFSNEVERLYQEAAIFCLSSRYEGFGMVLIEAMSQGCACVACDYKGRQADIIGGDDFGLTCSPDNPEMLSEKLGLLIEDSDLRVKLQNKAPGRSALFSLNRIMEMWDTLLNSLNN